MAGLISKLDNLLLDEQSGRITENAKLEKKSQKQMVKIIQEIGKTRDINLIMTAEKAINVHELQFYSNSKPMESSLKQTLQSIQITENLIDIVKNDIAIYQIISMAHSETKNRLNGLPLDEARQYFKSQLARFVNISKAPLSNDKKATMEARKVNIRLAVDIYIEMQQSALGVDNAK